MVFQSYALFPNMTVEGNIGYGLGMRGMAAGERSARVQGDAGDDAHRAAGASAASTSSRAASASACAGARDRVRPRVLLLDEPLTALDAKLREDLRVELDRLLRRSASPSCT